MLAIDSGFLRSDKRRGAAEAATGRENDAMASERFVYQASPQRVLFGSGTLAELPAEAERRGLRRILVLSTPGHRQLAKEAATLLGTATRRPSARPACTLRSRPPPRRWHSSGQGRSTVLSLSAGARRPASARRSRSAPTCRRSCSRRPMPGRRYQHSRRDGSRQQEDDPRPEGRAGDDHL